jgi:heme-degrading monooxygenase HmoA
MSVVKINAIEVPEGAGPELEARFAARAGAVEHQPGFQAFQLLRPVEGETRYFVMTWWESEEAFQGWLSSQDFAKGHANAGGAAAGGPGGHSGGGHPGGHPGGQPGGTPGGGQAPVATGASLLSFEVVEQIPAPPA